MRKNSYTEEQIRFLRDNYQKMSTRDLTPLFNERFGQNRTETAIRSVLTKHRIRCGRAHKDRFWNHPKMYTDEQVRFLRDNYKDISLADMTDRFNERFGTCFSRSQLRAAIRYRKIRSGRTGRFSKGDTPWNKGTKGLTGPNKGSYQKGNRPHNTRHLWHERVSKDGHIEISVPEKNPYTGFHRRFKAKHVWLWEQANGPVPEGHVVVFKDGDTTNLDLDNLALLSRLELLKLNQLKHKEAPGDVQPVMITLARLEAKAIRVKNNK